MYRAWNMNVHQASDEQNEEEIFSGMVFTFWTVL
jgi:hypothetical protein